MTMRLSDFLTDVGRPVAYYPGLRKITGSTNATIFLCQFIYWTGKGSSEGGWIYKTSDEIEQETGLSYKEQTLAREKLVSAGILEENYARLEHQMYFRVNLDALNEKWGNDQREVPELTDGKMGNLPSVGSLNSNSENTTENTTEKRRLSKEELLQNASLEFLVMGGVSDVEIQRLSERQKAEKAVIDLYEQKMGYNPLPWYTDKDLRALLRFLMDKSEADIIRFAAWSKKEFSPLSPAKARQKPRLVIECWPQAVPVRVSDTTPKEEETKWTPPTEKALELQKKLHERAGKK